MTFLIPAKLLVSEFSRKTFYFVLSDSSEKANVIGVSLSMAKMRALQLETKGSCIRVGSLSDQGERLIGSTI